MTNDASQLIRRLIRLLRAGEKGFNIAAENIQNRGLKVLFKTYARQRADYLRALAQAVDQEEWAEDDSGPLAAFHRGWINVKAAMTIGPEATESVVLQEVGRGERHLERAYAEVLKHDLDPRLHALLSQQAAGVAAVRDRVQELRGVDGSRLVVRLFDNQQDANEALDLLDDAGFARDRIDQVPLEEIAAVYKIEEENETLWESALAGAVLIGLVGLVVALFAAVGALVVRQEMSMFGLSFTESSILLVLIGLLVGGAFGALFGALIGAGVAQEDAHRYASSIDQGSVMLLVHTSEGRAAEATRLMRGVNARRWQTAQA